MVEVELKIDGLSCGHCVSSVETLFKSVDGVISTNISLPGLAEIMYDENKINIEALKKVINDTEIYKIM
jgi:copper chaperone